MTRLYLIDGGSDDWHPSRGRHDYIRPTLTLVRDPADRSTDSTEIENEPPAAT